MVGAARAGVVAARVPGMDAKMMVVKGGQKALWVGEWGRPGAQQAAAALPRLFRNKRQFQCAEGAMHGKQTAAAAGARAGASAAAAAGKYGGVADAYQRVCEERPGRGCVSSHMVAS